MAIGRSALQSFFFFLLRHKLKATTKNCCALGKWLRLHISVRYPGFLTVSHVYDPCSLQSTPHMCQPSMIFFYPHAIDMHI